MMYAQVLKPTKHHHTYITMHSSVHNIGMR